MSGEPSSVTTDPLPESELTIVWVSRSRSVYHGGTQPNCPTCDGSGLRVWPDGFAIKCQDCLGWGSRRG